MAPQARKFDKLGARSLIVPSGAGRDRGLVQAALLCGRDGQLRPELLSKRQGECERSRFHRPPTRGERPSATPESGI
jgi:hypothetical protein